jgi:hypothetical protein
MGRRSIFKNQNQDMACHEGRALRQNLRRLVPVLFGKLLSCGMRLLQRESLVVIGGCHDGMDDVASTKKRFSVEK